MALLLGAELQRRVQYVSKDDIRHLRLAVTVDVPDMDLGPFLKVVRWQEKHYSPEEILFYWYATDDEVRDDAQASEMRTAIRTLIEQLCTSRGTAVTDSEGVDQALQAACHDALVFTIPSAPTPPSTTSYASVLSFVPRSVSFIVAAAVGKLARDEVSGRLLWRGSAVQLQELTWYPDATGNVTGLPAAVGAVTAVPAAGGAAPSADAEAAFRGGTLTCRPRLSGDLYFAHGADPSAVAPVAAVPSCVWQGGVDAAALAMVRAQAYAAHMRARKLGDLDDPIARLAGPRPELAVDVRRSLRVALTAAARPPVVATFSTVRGRGVGGDESDSGSESSRGSSDAEDDDDLLEAERLLAVPLLARAARAREALDAAPLRTLRPPPTGAASAHGGRATESVAAGSVVSGGTGGDYGDYGDFDMPATEPQDVTLSVVMHDIELRPARARRRPDENDALVHSQEEPDVDPSIPLGCMVRYSVSLAHAPGAALPFRALHAHRPTDATTAILAPQHGDGAGPAGAGPHVGRCPRWARGAPFGGVGGGRGGGGGDTGGATSAEGGGGGSGRRGSVTRRGSTVSRRPSLRVSRGESLHEALGPRVDRAHTTGPTQDKSARAQRHRELLRQLLALRAPGVSAEMMTAARSARELALGVSLSASLSRLGPRSPYADPSGALLRSPRSVSSPPAVGGGGGPRGARILAAPVAGLTTSAAGGAAAAPVAPPAGAATAPARQWRWLWAVDLLSAVDTDSSQIALAIRVSVPPMSRWKLLAPTAPLTSVGVDARSYRANDGNEEYGPLHSAHHIGQNVLVIADSPCPPPAVPAPPLTASASLHQSCGATRVAVGGAGGVSAHGAESRTTRPLCAGKLSDIFPGLAAAAAVKPAPSGLAPARAAASSPRPPTASGAPPSDPAGAARGAPRTASRSLCAGSFPPLPSAPIPPLFGPSLTIEVISHSHVFPSTVTAAVVVNLPLAPCARSLHSATLVRPLGPVTEEATVMVGGLRRGWGDASLLSVPVRWYAAAARAVRKALVLTYPPSALTATAHPEDASESDDETSSRATSASVRSDLFSCASSDTSNASECLAPAHIGHAVSHARAHGLRKADLAAHDDFSGPTTGDPGGPMATKTKRAPLRVDRDGGFATSALGRGAAVPVVGNLRVSALAAARRTVESNASALAARVRARCLQSLAPSAPADADSDRGGVGATVSPFGARGRRAARGVAGDAAAPGLVRGHRGEGPARQLAFGGDDDDDDDDGLAPEPPGSNSGAITALVVPEAAIAADTAAAPRVIAPADDTARGVPPRGGRLDTVTARPGALATPPAVYYSGGGGYLSKLGCTTVPVGTLTFAVSCIVVPIDD